MILQFKTKNKKQIQAVRAWIDDVTEEIVYGGAKYGGKTYLGVSMIFGDAEIYDGTNYFIAREELTDLRKHTIPSIHEVYGHWGLDIDKRLKYNGQDNFFLLPNGSRVYLIACKELPSDPLYERFGSMQMTRGWIEEGGEVMEAAKRNLALSIGRWNNEKYKLKKKLLITCNPKKGWLKRDYIEPWKAGVLSPTKMFIPAFATDNKHGDQDYIKSLSETKDKVTRQRLWEGNWDYDEDDDSLITYDALSDAFSNTITKDNQRYMIVDVARLGKDSTVFSFWDGLELYRIEKFNQQGTDKTEEQTRDFAAQERIPFSNILVDEDGIGGAVVDHLKGIRGFIANSSPFPTATEIRERQSKSVLEDQFLPRQKRAFANLKAQCGWKLAELINEHKISFKVPEYRDDIVEELTALLRDKDKDNDKTRELKPKKDVKLELAHSPDLGDTLIYRAWFEIKMEATNADPVKQTKEDEKIEEHFVTNFNRIKEDSTR